jgi:DNA repair exonuclease SbcCD nuclease subunit
MKALFVTDNHLTKATPKYRTDGFYAQIMAKWAETYQVAAERGVDFVMNGGDIWHNPNPDMQVIIDAMKCVNVKTYVCCGNHDFKSDSWATLADTTALGLMEYTKHIIIPKEDVVIEEGGKKVLIRFCHYFTKDDPDRFVVKNFHDYALVIMVVHDALVNETMKFKHLLVDDLSVDADVVLSGHWHIPFKHQGKKTLFINPGSMTRLTRLPQDMERMPQMVYLEFDEQGFRYEMVPFKTALPWQEVFKTEQIIQDVADEKNLAEEFMGKIQASIGALNVEETIEQVAAEHSVSVKILDICRRYLKKVAA